MCKVVAMRLFKNPFRGKGLDIQDLADVPFPSTDADRPRRVMAGFPGSGETPLTESTEIARAANVARVMLKDERARMALGSFKALGAAYVIACDAENGAAKGATYVTASAGNHGISVAAGAAEYGARAVIYLSAQVPETFAAYLRSLGAEVVRAGDTYEESMAAAQEAATRDGAILLSDSSWPGYTERPHTLMEGYTVLMEEAARQMDAPPTHIFLQAGVGGLAGAAAARARFDWGDDPVIVNVEPEAAPALIASVEAGRPVETSGPVSVMGRLDCKEPSLIALKGLARDADFFATISEEDGIAGAEVLSKAGLATTPSGGAGVSGLLSCKDHFDALGLNETSRVLCILSEKADW